MTATIKKMRDEEFVVIPAATVAAAGKFVSKDKSRPALCCINVSVDNHGMVTLEATDSYILGAFHCGAVTGDGGFRERQLLLPFADLKKAIGLAARPKPNQWVAVKTAPDGNLSVRLCELDANDPTSIGDRRLFTTCEACVRTTDLRFPSFASLLKNRKVVKEGTPLVNSDYLSDVFTALQMHAPFDHGSARIYVEARDELGPMRFTAQRNEAGNWAEALLMPITQ